MKFTFAVGIILTFLFALVSLSTAQQEQESGVRRQRYTIAEYNAYEHALAQRDPEKQIQQLDDFASRYPASALLSLVYSQYAKAYGELGDFGKVIEFSDKLIALGDKVRLLSGMPHTIDGQTPTTRWILRTASWRARRGT